MKKNIAIISAIVLALSVVHYTGSDPVLAQELLDTIAQNEEIKFTSKNLLTGEISEYSLSDRAECCTKEKSSPMETVAEGFSGTETEVMIGTSDTPDIDPMKIIGGDSRIEVPNPSESPYAGVCYIEYTTGNGESLSATAWLAGPSVAVTSGHCVYDEGKGGWIQSMRVYPGYKKGNTPPFGYANVTDMHVYNAWIDKGYAINDFAILELDSAIGNKAGYFGFAYNVKLENKNVRVTGYPDLKAGIMRTAKGVALEDKTKRILYKTDTTGGQSGSPVYRGSTVYGVHSRGVSGKPYNAAYRIREDSFKWLLSFR